MSGDIVSLPERRLRIMLSGRGPILDELAAAARDAEGFTDFDRDMLPAAIDALAMLTARGRNAADRPEAARMVAGSIEAATLLMAARSVEKSTGPAIELDAPATVEQAHLTALILARLVAGAEAGRFSYGGAGLHLAMFIAAALHDLTPVDGATAVYAAASRRLERGVIAA